MVHDADEPFATELSDDLPVATRTLLMLQAELVELGREAWHISEREQAVHAEIEALYEAEENYALAEDSSTRAKSSTNTNMN